MNNTPEFSDVQRLDAPSCRLGEGPTYDRHSDTAWWFDILDRKLFEYHFQSRELLTHDLPFAASALARIDAHRQLVFSEKGLYIRDIASGELSLHLELETDNPLTRSNDARVHPSGAFWLGTMGWEAQTGAGSIYHYHAGQVRKLFGDISISNAICFSPDGQIGYYADTALGQVMRVALDALTGLPVAEPQVFLREFPADSGPDGAVTDADGNLWIALWGGSQVAGFAPNGDYLRSISMPATQVSCPAFVGSDARKMLVTSAFVGLTEGVDLTGDAGGTFVVELPFSGKFEPDVTIG